jgi:hypothetical protein
VNRTRNVVLVENGRVAADIWTRLRGLLGHPPLQPGEGLLLRGERAIHTIGMGFAIDALFLDREGRVRHVIAEMVPYRLSPFVRAANGVLELPAGTLARTGTTLGDMIELQFA